LSRLPDLHSISAGLKALLTWETHDGIEQCRQSLGGHGYSRFNGLCDMFNDFAVNCTWEGDNTVLIQQTARYLMKCAKSLAQGKKLTGKSVVYLNNWKRYLKNRFEIKTVSDILNIDNILYFLRFRSASLILDVSKRMTLLSKTMDSATAWNECQIDLIKAAKAHCYTYCAEVFSNVIKNCNKEDVKSVLTDLFYLYGLTNIQSDISVFFSFDLLNGKQYSLIKKAIRLQLKVIRKNAVALVDSFGWSDYVINSPFGRYDGDIYSHYMRAVKATPGCQERVPYYNEILKPFFKKTNI